MELTGILHWNEFETGFWSLDLDVPHAELGDRVVLVTDAIPSEFVDGARIRIAGTVQEGVVDFLMAGPRVEVNDVTVLG
ncbi:MAG: hypothetical protein JWM90_1331 [Thermoleophilia bacterium]|nr:hypothetical protein [Thermoleophilia bacterium]